MVVSSPDPIYAAADELHHRYAYSGDVILRMLGDTTKKNEKKKKEQKKRSLSKCKI